VAYCTSMLKDRSAAASVILPLVFCHPYGFVQHSYIGA
jgi:hypothetical protein